MAVLIISVSNLRRYCSTYGIHDPAAIWRSFSGHNAAKRSERRIPRDAVARNVTAQGPRHLVEGTLAPLVRLHFVRSIMVWILYS